MVAASIGAATDVEIDAQVAAAIARDQFIGNTAPLPVIHVQIDLDGVQAVLHPFQVRAEPDQPAIVGGHHFVNPVAKQEPAIHGRDFRLRHWHVIAIQVNRAHRINPLCSIHHSSRKPVRMRNSWMTRSPSSASSPSSVSVFSPCDPVHAAPCRKIVQNIHRRDLRQQVALRPQRQ